MLKFSFLIYLYLLHFQSLTLDSLQLPMATYDSESILFEDFHKTWPYLGSEKEKVQAVRQILKEHIYAQEAVYHHIDSGPLYEERLETLRQVAYREVLLEKMFPDLQVSESECRDYYLLTKRTII